MLFVRTAASVLVAAWAEFSSTLLQRLDLVKAECQGEATLCPPKHKTSSNNSTLKLENIQIGFNFQDFTLQARSESCVAWCLR